MAKTNAQRQADWRARRKQELHSLRNGSHGEGRIISRLSNEEYDFLMLQLEHYRAGRSSVSLPGRIDAIQALMRMKIDVDQTRANAGKPKFRKTRPVVSLNRDLFDE